MPAHSDPLGPKTRPSGSPSGVARGGNSGPPLAVPAGELAPELRSFEPVGRGSGSPTFDTEPFLWLLGSAERMGRPVHWMGRALRSLPLLR